MGLESPTPPKGGLPTDAGGAAPDEARPSSPPEPQPPAPATPARELPPTTEKADDLEAIKKAVDDAAAVGGGLWLSYLFVLFYLAVAAGAVTHADLFFENPVKLPFLNIELPLLAFFFVAPILFLVVHAYALVHLVMLTDKAKRYHQALHDPEHNVEDAARENLQWQLPSNIFIQFLAGPSGLRGGLFGWLLRAIGWATLVIAPIILLLMMQVQFLPFHSLFITWIQRLTLLVDLALIWWLWSRILSGREVDRRDPQAALNAFEIALLLSVAAILFSWTIGTFPGELQERFLAKWDRPKWMVTPHDWLFSGPVDETTRRRTSLFSSTLVLPGLNIYEGLGIVDPEKAKWHDFVFRARGRDLRGAILDFAVLPKVDFQGAELQRAFLGGARLQGASLQKAQLQGAWLNYAQLQGASLDNAQLQRAGLDGAQFQGASLNGAQLQGASLNGAQLRGATLDGAQLQAAALDAAQLQGASLKGADLQGASLQEADLNAADLSKPYFWRANLGSVRPVSAVRLAEADDTWRPHWLNDDGTRQQWAKDRKEDYERWRNNLDSFASDFPRPPQVLANIGRLDPSGPEPSEPAKWPKSLKDGRVDDRDYARALASELKTLVCWGVDDAIYAFHGNGFQDRLGAAGARAPAQVDFIDFIDFIMSKDCPVSASLTDADKAKLPQIRKEAAEEAIKEAATHGGFQ